ncbi:MAG: translocation/assembly module TamB domain-containing protein [Porphyromonas sp.]|nr:translocation/assembly module TamB domain-containing protein [Porphyromonas sp.]
MGEDNNEGFENRSLTDRSFASDDTVDDTINDTVDDAENIIDNDVDNSDGDGGNSDNESSKPKKKSLPIAIIRAIIRWVTIAIGSIVGLLIVLTLLLYIPFIQDWIISTATTKVEEQGGIKIEYKDIRIGFPLKIKLEAVKADDLKNQKEIGHIKLLTADVSIIPLLKGKDLPISGILLEEAKVDLSLSNDSVQINGNIGRLNLNRLELDLSTISMRAGQLGLKDTDVQIILLTDTVQQVKSGKKSEMVINFDRASIENVSADIWIYPDTINIAPLIVEGKFVNGEVDLTKGLYRADRIELAAKMSALGDEIEMLPMPWEATLKGNNMRYGGADNVGGEIQHLSYTVGDGVVVSDASFTANKDSLYIDVQNLELKIVDSKIKGDALIPFNGWIPDSIGRVDVALDGGINPTEVKHFLVGIDNLPDQLFAVKLTAKGAMDKALNYALQLDEDQTLDFAIRGRANRVLSEKRQIAADITMMTKEQLNQVLSGFIHQGNNSTDSGWRIPAGIGLKGSAKYSNEEASTDFQITNGTAGGTLTAKAAYSPALQSYNADLRIDQFAIRPFLPNDTVGPLSATINLEGHGTDPYNKHTSAILYMDVDSISYGPHSLTDIILLSQIKENQLFGAIQSDNEGLKLAAQTDILLKRDSIAGSINILVDTIIPSHIGVNLPVLESGKMELRSTVFTNLKENHTFQGEIENFILETDKGTIYPKNTYITANTTTEAMAAEVSSGDLSLKFKAQNGLTDFTGRINKVIAEVQKSLADSIGQVNMAPWIQYYPDMEVSLEMGRDNLLRAYLDEHRIGAKSIFLDLNTKEGEGLEGLGVVSYFQTDTFRIDNIDLVLRQDSAFFTAMATAHKEHFRNQAAFDLLLSLSSNVMRSEAYLNFLDARQKPFLQFGVELFNRPNGDLTFGFTPDPIVLAYNKFDVLEDDYLTLPKESRNRISSNLLLSNPGGTTISIKDIPDERGHLLRAKIHNLQLREFESIPIMPDLTGSLFLTADWLQSGEKDNEYSADLRIDNFSYNKRAIGDIALNAKALQNNNGNRANGQVSIDGKEVVLANAYIPNGEKEAKYHLTISDLSLEKANPLLPEKVVQTKGYVEGEVSNYDVTENIVTAQAGRFNGQLLLREASVYTPIANETYEMDSRPILIIDDHVLFDNYALNANQGHLVINGGFQLFPDLFANLDISGQDVLLLNSTQTKETLVYGRVNTDATLGVRGPLKSIEIKGNVSVKGDTDVTYHSQTGELQNRNGYEGLVTFTDFSDTLFVKRKEAVDSLSLGGMDIQLAVHIDPATKVNAILTKDGGNKVSLQGGGDFNLSMPPYGSMTLNGTYNIQEGDVVLNLSPLSRRFIVQPGSHVAWNGILMEPEIDVKATSIIKSNVSMPGEPTRQVEFHVNVIAEDKLNDLQLRFETEAPQDMTMRNALAGLSPEEQNRQSIMLLTLGYYIGNGSPTGGKGFDVNGALSSLLASQINSLAGEALDAEINFGISDGTNAYGEGTNYSYSITKKLMNNRISVQVGGKMVTGAAAAGLQQTFIDNMSLDYQLDQAGTHYLRLFHNKNYENLLDGEVIETGIGYLIRRKHDRLWDLFKFSNPFGSNEPAPRALWQLNVIPPRDNNSEDEETESDED